MSSTPTFSGRAERVTLFEDRAEVVRIARIDLDGGSLPGAVFSVAVEGISPLIDDRSLQVRALGDEPGPRVLSASVTRTMSLPDAAGAEAVEALEQGRLGAHRALLGLTRARDRTTARQKHLDAIGGAWIESLSRIPDLSQDAEGWSGAWAAMREASEQAARELVELNHQSQRATEALSLAERRLHQARQIEPRCGATVVVQLDGAELRKGGADGEPSTAFELELTYRVPCALWRPEHLARLVPVEGGHEVEIITWATAWQITGEDWNNVSISFSTARPASAAAAPLVEDDVVWSRRKTDQERKNVVVETRDQTIQTSGEATGQRDSEMPGVDDGGEPVTYSPSAAISLPSTGEPLRVEVCRVRLPASVKRTLTPELALVAHHKASLTLKGDKPLLAGPMRLARGSSLVGLSRVDFVAAGAPFELGFGPDDAIRARRKIREERDRTAIVNTQKITREVTISLSNLSGQPRALTILERIPVSEIEAVEIHLDEAHGWTLDPQDGFLTADLLLAPKDTRQLSLTYTIKAGSQVVLPF